MSLCLLDIYPTGKFWGDYEMENTSDSEFIPMMPILFRASTPSSEPRGPRWCKHGNACVWSNCKFRHERCEHFDRWIASGKKTRGCRCIQTDPENCKSPEEGGCKYDHRDLSQLREYVEIVSIESESDMWEKFYDMGLRMLAADSVDPTLMSRVDYGLLIRSLIAAEKNGVLEFVEGSNWVDVVFTN